MSTLEEALSGVRDEMETEVLDAKREFDAVQVLLTSDLPEEVQKLMGGNDLRFLIYQMGQISKKRMRDAKKTLVVIACAVHQEESKKAVQEAEEKKV